MEILLTGCCGQLGKEISASLKKRGVKIIGVDLENDSYKENLFAFHQLDITNLEDVCSIFEKYPALDGIINNAGIGVFTPTLDRTVEDFMSVMNVNLLGTFLVSQQYIKAKINNGKIVNIASMYGHISSDYRIYGNSGRNNSEVYTASKAGVIALTKYMAANFAKSGFTCNSVSPGGIYNEQSRDFLGHYYSKSPQNRLADVSEVATVVEFLALDAPTHLNGEDIIVDGGFTKW